MKNYCPLQEPKVQVITLISSCNSWIADCPRKSYFWASQYRNKARFTKNFANLALILVAHFVNIELFLAPNTEMSNFLSHGIKSALERNEKFQKLTTLTAMKSEKLWKQIRKWMLIWLVGLPSTWKNYNVRQCCTCN